MMMAVRMGEKRRTVLGFLLGAVASLAIVGLAAGCTAWQRPGPSIDSAAARRQPADTTTAARANGPAADSVGSSIPATVHAGRGAIVLRVKWPDYRTQAIPFSTHEIGIFLRSAGAAPGAAPIATASIVRPSTTATLSAIATGSYTLALEARRGGSARTLVAEASTSVAVFANRVSQAHLVLVPKIVPQLDFIEPTSGPPGTVVYLYGANLAPPAGGTYSVTVDGVPVPALKLQPGANTIVITNMPSGNQATSAVAVSVDGVPVPDSQIKVFTRFLVDHIRIDPASATMSAGATMSFSATAFQDAAETATADLAIQWRLADLVPPADPFSLDPPPFSIESQVLAARATGSVTVVASAGGKEATASVKVE